MYAGNGGPTRQDSYFLSPFMPKTAEMALPVPTKTFLLRSPDTAMLFAPFGCTHPPPPVPPFLLSQNLSPKVIAGCDIMKLKVPSHLKTSLAGKGLNWNKSPPFVIQGQTSNNTIRYTILIPFQDWLWWCDQGGRLWSLRRYLLQALLPTGTWRYSSTAAHQMDGTRESTGWYLLWKNWCSELTVSMLVRHCT